ncbi:homeobox KN domain-containing protein [Jimgerdemannia flammicorona]|uniref:Homeobox KN domain-containing protein n=1 Tax=Jimgerdemannia flammicorona TaxID=994334 RepID=A0A433Q788_9FUNG|nr:homeobox KN domain-containing protein [Jimgerdemannia flammicorona]
MHMNTADSKLRTFSPIILYHDHEYVKEESGERVHHRVDLGDPHYNHYIQQTKQRVHHMLENNGKMWSELMHYTREIEYRTSHYHGQLSPSSSLSSRRSSLSPPLMHRDASIPPYNAPPTPPEHGSDTKVVKRRRGNLPKTVTIVLRDWLVQHKKHPYPTEDEKQGLAKQTKLTMNQISNWFINARRRILQPMLNSEHARSRAELDIYPYEATDNSDDSNSDHSTQKSLKRPASKTALAAKPARRPYAKRQRTAMEIS